VSDNLINKLIDNINKLIEEDRIREIVIFTSVDTWGEHAEYIRTGMVFNKFWDNINKILSKCNRVNITIMSTYNALSVLKYNKLITEVYKLKEEYAGNRYSNTLVLLDTSYLRYPQHQTIKILPLEFSTKILNHSKLMNYYSTPYFNNDSVGFSDVEIQKIKRLYDWMILPNDEQEILKFRHSFYKHFSEHDRRRVTNFIKVFPELEDFYESCKLIKL
jgi:hypothetical protein